MELGNYLDGDSHLDAYWVRGLYDRLPLVGADNVVDAASNNRGNTNADTKANQQRLLIASHDAGSGEQHATNRGRYELHLIMALTRISCQNNNNLAWHLAFELLLQSPLPSVYNLLLT